MTTIASAGVVTLTATVKAGGAPVTTGQVNFCDASAKYCTDIHLLGSAQLTSSGTAAVKFRPGIGSHRYMAVFLQTNSRAKSSSAASALAVTGVASQDSTMTAITKSGNWGSYELSATIAEAGDLPALTGKVSFLDTSNGNAVLGTADLGAGTPGLAWLGMQSSLTGRVPEGIGVGDFNGDGIPDLAIPNGLDNTVTILLGKGDGTFTAATVSPATGSSPAGIAVGDFNGDGKQDLAVVNDQSDTVTILLGNGDGTFTAAASPATQVAPVNIAIGDFNGDGIADLVVTSSFSNIVTILLGNGDGTFTPAPASFTLSAAGNIAVVGDFNGDGKADLAIASNDVVFILLGNGDGTFAAGTSFAISSWAGSIAVGDLNGDGKLDLAVGNGQNIEGESTTVAIFLGNGDGTFTAAPILNVADPAETIAIGDFNQDGIPDLAIPTYSGVIAVMLGNGDGTFTASSGNASAAANPTAIVVADFNGDGRPDLAVTSSFNDTVAALITAPTQIVTTAPTAIAPGALGNHLVEASYSGDSNYTSSVSGTTVLWGVPPATATTLALTAGGKAATTAASGTAVTLTASVKVGGSALTSGQVNFCDATDAGCTDIHLIGTGALTNSGIASITVVPGPGKHSYKAVLLESGYGLASSSPAESLTVSAAPPVTATTTTTITESGNAGAYTLSATVSATGSAAPLTGSVSFLDTSYTNSVLATAPLGTDSPGLAWSVSSTTPFANAGFVLSATGDFNGDGIPDLAVVSEYGDTVTVLLGKGDGTFTTGSSFTFTAALTSIVTGDFNGDGHIDLAVSTNNFSGTQEAPGTVTILLGKGDGSFTQLAPTPATGRAPSAIQVADFNGDGKLDLLVFSSYDNPAILLGNGDGTFAIGPVTGLPASEEQASAVADFNGDGVPDLVMSVGDAGLVYLGNGDGTFQPTQTPLNIGTEVGFAVAGDFNGDGIPDLALLGTYYSPATVFLGNGDGTFTQAAIGSNPSVNEPGSMAVADINQDGKLDLVITNWNSFGGNLQDPDLTFMLGNGDGTFTVIPGDTQLNATWSLSIADFNGDGIPDIAVGTGVSEITLLTEPTQTATATAAGVSLTGAGPHLVDASYPGDTLHSASTSTTTQLSAQVATPVISPISGSYTSIQTVSITGSTPGASIYYQRGSGQFVPYTGSFTVSQQSQIVQAYATETGYVSSATATSNITLNLAPPAPPVLSLAAGSYPGAQTVTISDATQGASIYYTTNGTTPTLQSTPYSGQFTVSSSETVVAIATYGYATSAPVSAQYLIGTSSSPFIYTFAGNGTYGYTGDNGPATVADLADPYSPVLDAAGNLYFADYSNHVVRKVAAGTGVVTTVVGSGTSGYSGDNGPATSAELSGPRGLAFDSAGNLYISDEVTGVVRKVTAATGVISTYAGTGTSGYSGDNGAATSAQFDYPLGIAIDGDGNLYIVDSGNLRIRKVAAGTGIITTYAGNGSYGYIGDGGPAINAGFVELQGLAIDKGGNLYITDSQSSVIREVNATSGVISTVAGNGKSSYTGDGGAATSASLNSPQGMAVDGAGDLFIADSLNAVIRKVSAGSGIISTYAGNGPGCSSLSGDGAPATSATICDPTGLSVDALGNLYVATTDFNEIRLVTSSSVPPVTATTQPIFNVPAGTYASTQTVNITDAASGAAIYVTFDGSTPTTLSPIYNGPIIVTGTVTITAIALAPGYLPSAPVTAAYTITTPPAAVITTFAGGGTSGFSTTPGLATAAQLGVSFGTQFYSEGMAFDSTGNLYFTDSGNGVVWMVSATTGSISVVAGGGTCCNSGDGNPATSVQLSYPAGLALDSAGNLYISEAYANVVRKVTASTGIISTVAGNGQYGQYGPPYTYGDGGPATSANLNQPTALAVDGAGNLYIADTDHSKIRQVSAITGIISTVAGTGVTGDSGDGSLAIDANLFQPNSIALDSAGNLYIEEFYSGYIRVVNAATGIISTVAGSQYGGGEGGDGGLATAATVSPAGIAIDGAGNLYIANWQNEIREVSAATGIITKVAGNGYTGFSGDGGSATIAELNGPTGIALDAAGSVYFADTFNNRIRKVAFPITTSEPVFSVKAGTYSSAQTVSITDAAQGAVIYYTTDGSLPTTTSTTYSGPITVSQTETLKAVAIAAGRAESTVTFATYTINLSSTLAITWTPPAAISYGTALSATQLDATSTVAGSFVYKPAAGTVLSAGVQTLRVTFTPTDTADYSVATATVSLTVNKAAPAVTLKPSLSTITTSQPLMLTVSVSGVSAPAPTGSVVLTSGTYHSAAATLSNGGTTINVAAGSLAVGSDTIIATYTPDTISAANYATAAQSAAVTVTSIGTATSTVTVTPSATTVTNEQSLTATIAVSGSDGQPSPTGTVTLTSGSYSAQQALSNGTASFNIAAGALANGADTLIASYSGDATFADASASTAITVSPVTIVTSAPSPVSPGGSSTATATFTAGSNYAGTMNLTCGLTSSPSGAQSLPTCALKPLSITLAAGGSGTTTLTINTTAASTSALLRLSRQNLWGLGAGGAVLAALLFGVPRRRRWLTMMILLAVAAGGCLIGCGGGNGGGGQSTGPTTPATTAGTYVFTVSGTDSTNKAITFSTTVSITVQ